LKIKAGQKVLMPSNWHSIMGLQFENLVVNNRREIYRLLNISEEEIVCANPYWHSAGIRKESCQIDFLIQTRFNVLYVFEVKFKSQPIGIEIIHEMKEKIQRLNPPKGFSCSPVLIHVNGVESAVLESDYFAHILDFGQLLMNSF
jgi:hypothetical protein